MNKKLFAILLAVLLTIAMLAFFATALVLSRQAEQNRLGYENTDFYADPITRGAADFTGLASFLVFICGLLMLSLLVTFVVIILVLRFTKKRNELL